MSLAGCEGGGKGKTLEHLPTVQTKEQSPPCGLWGHREQELGDGAGDQAGGGWGGLKTVKARQGWASNPTHCSPFTYEGKAAQRGQVTQTESHSTWVAEAGRYRAPSQWYPNLPRLCIRISLGDGGTFKTTHDQAPTQEILIPQPEVGVGSLGG